MTRFAKQLTWTMAVLLATAASGAAAELRASPSRPGIVEVGPPRALSTIQLEHEMSWNSDMRSWVLFYGYPDVAEYQAVLPQYGWAAYEIHTYYLARNQEVVFGRVAPFALDALPGYPGYHGYPGMLAHHGLIKHQGAIDQADLQRLSASARR